MIWTPPIFGESPTRLEARAGAYAFNIGRTGTKLRRRGGGAKVLTKCGPVCGGDCSSNTNWANLSVLAVVSGVQQCVAIGACCREQANAVVVPLGTGGEPGPGNRDGSAMIPLVTGWDAAVNKTHCMANYLGLCQWNGASDDWTYDYYEWGFCWDGATDQATWLIHCDCDQPDYCPCTNPPVGSAATACWSTSNGPPYCSPSKPGSAQAVLTAPDLPNCKKRLRIHNFFDSGEFVWDMAAPITIGNTFASANCDQDYVTERGDACLNGVRFSPSRGFGGSATLSLVEGC
jgi:hypothetical protein